ADATEPQPLGAGLAVPQIAALPVNADTSPKSVHATVAVLLDAQGVIRASSLPVRYIAGRSTAALLPITKLSENSGTADTADGAVTWALVPIIVAAAVPAASPSVGGDAKAPPPKLAKLVIGWAYAQTPAGQPGFATGAGPTWLSALAALPDSSIAPLLVAGAALLALVIPLGAAFGVWTSRSVVTRLGTLAHATGDFALGDLSRRVVPGTPDEVGAVERGFNDMATRIQQMTSDAARLVDERARGEERARIARELHDSISQDLFSIGLIAGGLARALPADSPVQSEIAAMRGTVDGTMSEMRALLLELRPTQLDERGLVPALTDLCAAYRERLGVTIDAKLEPIDVTPPADHAVLRIAQEGIANAVRHADARRIELALARREDGRTELVVADDGRGFDQSAADSGYGLGLRVMRERLRELGGSLVITSELGRGTRLVATIP
ncbi:MAG TPA: sensor histidine kinase, partial [Candidatus Limnocylindria bacterium]